MRGAYAQPFLLASPFRGVLTGHETGEQARRLYTPSSGAARARTGPSSPRVRPTLILYAALVAQRGYMRTEIDALSLSAARENVRANALEGRISIREADPAGPIFGPLFDRSVPVSSPSSETSHLMPDGATDSDGAGYDFTMCNPPFYGSREEVQQSAEGKEHGPNAVRIHPLPLHHYARVRLMRGVGVHWRGRGDDHGGWGSGLRRADGRGEHARAGSVPVSLFA